jgi:hypothetical protein
MAKHKKNPGNANIRIRIKAKKTSKKRFKINFRNPNKEMRKL